MDSNITLRSNVYINQSAQRDDKKFLQHITDYRVLKRYKGSSYGFQNNISWMTPVQLEILRQGQPNCSLEKGTMSWGVPVGGERMDTSGRNDVPFLIRDFLLVEVEHPPALAGELNRDTVRCSEMVLRILSSIVILAKITVPGERHIHTDIREADCHRAVQPLPCRHNAVQQCVCTIICRKIHGDIALGLRSGGNRDKG